MDTLGNPIEGVELIAYDINLNMINGCYTDKDGLYEIDNLPLGEYLLQADPGDLPYYGQWYNGKDTANEADIIELTDSLEEINFFLHTIGPRIDVAPPSIDFGSVKVSTSFTETITVKNTGSEDLIIETLSIIGNEFSIKNDTCSDATIPPDNSCTVDIVFSPTSEGDKSATLEIPSNDPDTPIVNVPLSGKGIPPQPNISVALESLNFDTVGVGKTSTQTVTITNTGEAALVIGILSITGTNLDEFSIENDTCSNQTIPLNNSCTVDIVFSPTSEGDKSATLEIPSNDPDTPIVNVPLSGTGKYLQIIIPEPNTISAVPKSKFTFTVRYDVSDNDNTLTGIGLRIHYDSSILEWVGFSNVFEAPFVFKSTDPQIDEGNEDNDTKTDKIVLISFTDSGGNFPNQPLPLNLFDISFKVLSEVTLPVQTNINFTASDTALGYGFQSTPVKVNIRLFCLDIDANGESRALTDGLLILRYLFGFRGIDLVADVVDPNGERTDTREIENYIGSLM